MKKEQTKGYALLVGEIYGVDNKEPRKTEYRNDIIKLRNEKGLFL